MRPRSVGSRTLLLLCTALLAMGVGAVFMAADGMRNLELSSIDARFDLRGEQQPPAQVVVVGIDDETLDAEPRPTYPLNRQLHASVIRKLDRAGAKVIAYDVPFTEASGDVAADNALILAVRSAAPRVVLGTDKVDSSGETQIFGGGEGLAFSRATPAATSYSPEPDGVIRRMPSDVRGLESFALAAARLHAGRPVTMSPADSAWIDFPGPPGTVRELSFGDVEAGRFDPADVRGKVVVVGPTAARTLALEPTATGSGMPGVELAAASIATALAGFELQQADWWIDLLIALALGALAPFVALRFGAAAGLAAGALAIALFLGGALLAFNSGVIVAVVPAMAAAITALAGTAIVTYSLRRPWLSSLLDRVTRGARQNQQTRRLRAGLLLGAAVVIAAIGLALEATNALQRIEYGTVNARFDVRGPDPPPGDIVLVAIDEATYQTEPKPTHPLDRRMHANVIRELAEADAKVIAYDVQFTEPSGNPDSDKALRQAIRAAAPRVVLATTEVEEDGRTQILGGNAVVRRLGATPSFSAYRASSDGRIRRVMYEERSLEGFDTAAARLALGRAIPEPPESHGWLDFFGPPFLVRAISFRDVARGDFPRSAVDGKVIVVGSTASVDQDRHATPTTEDLLMPGPEIHANGIATALDGFPLHDVPGWLDALLVVALAVCVPLAALRLRVGIALAIGFAAVAVLLVGAQLAFENDAIVTVTYPLVAAGLALIATGTIHALTVAFERAKTREAFARFVPEAVVDEVLRNADGARLGGVQRESTVMFSDLRGFTSFSETLEPAQVIDALNRYLTEMSEAILDHGGTLVAYMGDGIMAVFGAPLQQDDHADRALAAARDMLVRLEGFNDWLRKQELHDGFKMGIGLNTGRVMSGHVGSERRLEYTALGDTTNTAARLEGMTKGTPHQLFVADSTRAALIRPADDLVEVGEFEVRGRRATIKLWSLREDEPAPEPAEQPVVADEAGRRI